MEIQMDEETTPQNNQFSLEELAVDATSIVLYAVLLARGALRGLLREQDGLDDVLREIAANQTTCGARAGVLAEDVRLIQLATERLAQVRKYLSTVRKLLMILESTEAYLDNERHQMINIIATSVDRRAKKTSNRDLFARYALTRAYRSANANKAAKTRRRNAAAEDEAKVEVQAKLEPQTQAAQAR
jgi:DNA polymerase III psi subunit